MKILGRVFCLLVSIAFFAAAGPGLTAERGLVEKVIDALGGEDRLRAVKSVKITSSSINFGSMTSYAVDAPPIHLSDGEDEILWEPRSQRFRLHSKLKAIVPFPSDFDFEEAFDGTYATRRGPKDYRRSDDPALPGAYLGARHKRLQLDNPHWQLRRMSSVGRRSTYGKKMYVLELGQDNSWEMLVDPDSMLPHSMKVEEIDGLHGTVALEIRYSDWREVDGIMMPYRIEEITGGVLSRREVRTEILVNVEVSDEIFRLADVAQLEEYKNSERLWGWKMSHWFLGRYAMGRGSETRQFVPVEFREIGEGIFHITGTTHHNLVVVGPDSLAVFEAPFYGARSKEVLAALRRRWPGKPVQYLILTHHHTDHIGGMIEYVKAGAQLVVAAANENFFREILAASEIEQRIEQREIITIGERGELPDFGRPVELLWVPNSHAFDMIVAYFPDQKLLFATDIYSPGRPKQPPNYPGELLQAIRYYDLDVSQFIGGHGAGPDSFARFLEFAN